MRRALVTTIAIWLFLLPARADASDKTVHLAVGGSPSPSKVTINGGDSVTWRNDDPTLSHKIFIDGGDITNGGIAAHGGTLTQSFPDPGDSDATVTYHVDSADGTAGTVVVQAAATTTTTTTRPTTTTKASTTASSSTTTSTSSTTTTTTSTTTTTLLSSNSGLVAVPDKGASGGGSSALPLLLGALVAVAGLAGLAYWLWLRSGEPIDDGPDWTQEPPPTVQGPRI